MRRISENQNDPHRYDDMLDLPHPVSKNHKQMRRLDRAAQFKPFAALTGYEESLQEAARLTEKRKDLSEEDLQELNDRLAWCDAHAKEHPLVLVRYFKEDETKAGGTYLVRKDRIRQVDALNGYLIFLDRTRIAIADIAAVELEEETH
jgi:hypothetical protein